MNLLKSIISNFREKGIARTLTIIAYRMLDFQFDLKYKTDTTSKIFLEKLNISSENKSRGNPYQPTMARPFNRLMGKILLPADSVMVDFGCGKGRVLLLAVLGGVRRAVGVEFSAELCEIARKNVKIVEKQVGRKLQIEIVEADVAHYNINDEQNIFFLFNPFDECILNKVIGNILKSLRRRERKILLIYYNPIYQHAIERHFTKKGKYLIAGEEYLLYGNNAFRDGKNDSRKN